MRVSIWAGLAVLLLGCAPREPSDADLLQALRRYHQEWAAQQRRNVADTHPPLVDLPFEAGLALYIHALRKEVCRPAGEEMGFHCLVEVEASTPFTHTVRRRIEARFVEGTDGWLTVMPRPREASGDSAVNAER